MEIVQRTLRDALQHPQIRPHVDPTLYQSLMFTIDHVIPEAITLIIHAGRGEITFKKPSKGCISSLLSCFGIAAAALGAPQIPMRVAEKEPTEEELRRRASSSSAIQIALATRIPEILTLDPSKSEPEGETVKPQCSSTEA